jgi:subtilisin family serine protease
LNSSGSGTASGIISGVDHVVKKCLELGGLCVANMSLGFSAVVKTINAAVANAVSKGVVMVVAAGNSNKDACFFSPASATSAITVGSTDNTDTDARSSFSNYGNCVDVYAPGSRITSAWKGGTAAINTISGTSMASPRKSQYCCS